MLQYKHYMPTSLLLSILQYVVSLLPTERDANHGQGTLNHRGTVNGVRSALVAKGLQVVRPELVLVQQHVVVRRAGGALQACVALQEEAVFCRMDHATVQHCACRMVTRRQATCY